MISGSIPSARHGEASQPVANTTTGEVGGVWRDSCAAFLGIPFAAAPVGPLRFAAPAPHPQWEGVRDATVQGPTPLRGQDDTTLIPEPPVPGDATLNLNVFMPNPTSCESGALPVLVYIHGGGFFSGSIASPWYTGESFARDGVVTVVISYRLGFEGFGWVEGAPHNRGVLDWLAGLEWVQENIANFGGDPGRVTLAGQSAGGGAALTLLGMASAQHLFQSVYSISGATADVSAERAQTYARDLAATLGVTADRDGFESVPELTLLAAQKKTMDPSGPPIDMLRDLTESGLALGPTVDGQLIARPTLESLHAGIGADKPLVLGSTEDEFSIAFVAMRRKMMLVPARPLLGKLGLTGSARRDYLAENSSAKGTAGILGRYISDSLFGVLILRVLEARGQAPTWTYRFTWRSPVHDLAFHCLDVPFFFDCLDAEGVSDVAGENPPQALASAVHAGAVALVKTGNPGWRLSGGEGYTQMYGNPLGHHAAAALTEATKPTNTVRNGYRSVVPLLHR